MDREMPDRESLSPETIEDSGALRARYAEPSERVRRKCLPQLDKHCRNFIARSPFLCLGTADAEEIGRASCWVRL